ncbi:transposable element Tcb2 transposase [Trichonephila clavipes]|nr:transposable element Tcb2 transposase [Trichonephila clavipes]
MSTMSQRSHLTDSEARRVVGRPKTRTRTTPNEDRYLVLTARRHRNINATLLQQHLLSATGTTVSTQTVRNRLRGLGQYARRPMVCVRLTSRHRRDHRERIFIWKDRGSRNNPAFMHESVRFSGGRVLVYSGISIDGCTDVYIIRDGPLTARRYKDEILRPIVVPYAATIRDAFILMDDNCRPHRANLVEDFLFREDELLAANYPPPETLKELERALLEEGDRIPQLVIYSLIDSMPQRGVGTSVCEICHLREDHAQDSFDRPVTGKTTASYKLTVGPNSSTVEPCGFLYTTHVKLERDLLKLKTLRYDCATSYHQKMPVKFCRNGHFLGEKICAAYLSDAKFPVVCTRGVLLLKHDTTPKHETWCRLV